MTGEAPDAREAECPSAEVCGGLCDLHQPDEYAPVQRVTIGGHEPIPHREWMDLLRKRFGPDPHDWAFKCPGCGDVATGTDFEQALARNGRAHTRGANKGTPVVFGDIIGQECIGRSLGALRDGYEGRGCNWVAYGLIPGPIGVALPDGREIRVFAAAEAIAVQQRTAGDAAVET